MEPISIVSFYYVTVKIKSYKSKKKLINISLFSLLYVFYTEITLTNCIESQIDCENRSRMLQLLKSCILLAVRSYDGSVVYVTFN